MTNVHAIASAASNSNPADAPMPVMYQINRLPGLQRTPDGTPIPDEAAILGFDRPFTSTPSKDPNHEFRFELSQPIINWMASDDPDGLLIYGPMGAGKSSEIRQLCAWLNRPMYSISGHAELEFFEFVGRTQIVCGMTNFEYGPLVQAMSQGALFLYEEMDRARGTVNIALNSVLDGYPLVIGENGAETIAPRKGFRFAATANTNGSGEGRSAYGTAEDLDFSTLDRFASIRTDYMQPDAELRVLKRHYPNHEEANLAEIIDFANQIRGLYCGKMDAIQNVKARQVEAPMSTRTLVRFIRWIDRYSQRVDEAPLLLALQTAFTNRLSTPARDAIHTLAGLKFGFSVGGS